MTVPPRPPVDLSAPMWLAHHHREHLDRCVRVGHTAVCRRCIVLYPCVLVCWALWLWWSPSASTLVLATWVLPLPMLADWVLEHLRRLRASPARLTAVTVLSAPGLAAMLALHTQEPLDPRALVPAAVFGAVALGAAWRGARTDGSDDWRRRHLAEEARRARRLRALLDLDGDEGRPHDRLQSHD